MKNKLFFTKKNTIRSEKPENVIFIAQKSRTHKTERLNKWTIVEELIRVSKPLIYYCVLLSSSGSASPYVIQHFLSLILLGVFSFHFFSPLSTHLLIFSSLVSRVRFIFFIFFLNFLARVPLVLYFQIYLFLFLF